MSGIDVLRTGIDVRVSLTLTILLAIASCDTTEVNQLSESSTLSEDQTVKRDGGVGVALTTVTRVKSNTWASVTLDLTDQVIVAIDESNESRSPLISLNSVRQKL